jgi:HlyD family secretion protein
MLPGTIDANEVELGFQVSGRIAELLVDEGAAVKAGETLATLDARDYELQLRRARAEAEAAKMALAALRAGTREQELRVAETALIKAEAELRFAESEVDRLMQLISKKLASQERLDRAEMEKEVAQAGVDQAVEQLQLAREGPRGEDVARAAAEYEARRAEVELARQRLTYAELTSPLAGVVSVRLGERGEVVTTGQAVLKVAELARPWVRAYLKETDLARVALGQDAEVRADGLPDKIFNGKLSFIAPEAEFTPKTVETRALRVDLVYRIKIDVPNPEGILKIGMPVDAKLMLKPRSGS